MKNDKISTENKVRIARISDLKIIIDIYNQNIENKIVTADTQKINFVNRLEWFQQHDAKNPLWVITDNQQIVGWLSLQPFYGRKAYEITKEISIYISNNHNNNGMATLLLNHAAHFCKNNSIENLLAFIFKENAPSINFFKKNNFELWGAFPQVALLGEEYRTLNILGKKI